MSDQTFKVGDLVHVLEVKYGSPLANELNNVLEVKNVMGRNCYVGPVNPRPQNRLSNCDIVPNQHLVLAKNYKKVPVVKLKTNGGYGSLFKPGQKYIPTEKPDVAEGKGAHIRPLLEDDPDQWHQENGLYFLANEFTWEYEVVRDDLEPETPATVTVTVPRDTASAFAKAYTSSGMLSISGRPPAPEHRALLRKVFEEALESAEVREAKRLLENQGYKVVKE